MTEKDINPMTNPTPKEILEGLEKSRCFIAIHNGPSLSDEASIGMWSMIASIQAAIDYIKATMWVPIDDNKPRGFYDLTIIDKRYDTRKIIYDTLYCNAVTDDEGWRIHDGYYVDGEDEKTKITHFRKSSRLPALGEPE